MTEPDRLVERPPLIVYNSDIDRLRRFGMDNGCGDSAVALRRLLDVGEGNFDGIVGYWRDTYARRTQEAHKLRGALHVIAAQVAELDYLPWWRLRRRRRHELAIRETLKLVLG